MAIKNLLRKNSDDEKLFFMFSASEPEWILTKVNLWHDLQGWSAHVASFEVNNSSWCIAFEKAGSYKGCVSFQQGNSRFYMPPKVFNLLQNVISPEWANSWGLSARHKSLYLKKKPKKQKAKGECNSHFNCLPQGQIFTGVGHPITVIFSIWNNRAHPHANCSHKINRLILHNWFIWLNPFQK